MKIKLTSLFVNDQSAALAFYRDVLGFLVSQDLPVGDYRWIQLASPEGEGAELSLEPNVNPAAKDYQTELYAQGIPAAAFEVDDLEQEVARLIAHGVTFTTPPTQAGDVSIAVFDDTVGNMLQIYQMSTV